MVEDSKMKALEIPNSTIQILTLVYTGTAIFLTIFRLLARKRARWWLDDCFAFIGMLAIILQLIVLWMRIRRVPALMKNQTANIAFFYLNSLCLYVEDWGARLSILWSIIRIAPSSQMRIRLRLVGIFFFMTMVGNGIILIATCESDPAWHTNRIPPRCKLKESVPIYRIVTGIFADSVLVLTPIRILQGLKSAPRLKRRLIIIFCASLFMTIACIVQSIITMTLPGDPELVASLTEGFIALVTCNLTIVVTAIYRLVGAKNGLEADIGRTGFTAPPSAIQFRTFTAPGNVQSSATTSDVPDSGFKPTETHTGLASLYTEDERRSAKSETEGLQEDEVLDIRTTTSFIDRWRALDVDAL